MIDSLLQKPPPPSDGGSNKKFLYLLLAVLLAGFYYLDGKVNTIVIAYQSVSAENNTARTNIRALGQSECWKCHGITGKFLPRRQYLTEGQFLNYIRSVNQRNGSDKGQMPEYTPEQISDDDVKRMYLILYSTLARN